jgi:pilus assembly protein CpaF
LRDGTRRVIKIVEIMGMEGEVVTTQDIFEFVATGTEANGRIIGSLEPRALRPRLLVNMTEAGIAYPPAVSAIWPEQRTSDQPSNSRDRRQTAR